ncbi:MAG TPA: hypothetical protein VFW11_22580 [Cyclobacteriaceae bacterium]|nr:hypothetical protein [Cyclobacteriaceae bacterium]
MKFPSLFTKTPPHRKFSFTPRFYDPREEERKEREERIRKELKEFSEINENENHFQSDYRSRIAGSFKSARRSASRQKSPSTSLLRIIILTFLSIWLIAFLQFGNVAFYALLLFIPLYLFMKSRESKG